MSLSSFCPIGFIPIRDPRIARPFYEGTLGLVFESEDPFALVFRLGPVRSLMLRLVRTPEFTPMPYTIFGWEVPSIGETIDELTAKGVVLLRFGSLPQDERAIWHAPGGASVAWFHDPDGNTLSLSQHPY